MLALVEEQKGTLVRRQFRSLSQNVDDRFSAAGHVIWR
jgi:hypothetical protein